jgi:hypothetical protein
MTESLLIWGGVILAAILMTYGIINQSDLAYVGYGLLLGSAASAVKRKGVSK